MRWSLLSAAVIWLLLPSSGAAAGEPVTRSRPQPLPAHPGNIFLRGDAVVVAPPAGKTKTWRLFDGDERLLADHDV
ncbi:MAG: hypothetical protein PHU85_18685, partial [Phycisphaerae bacterium]|nr:hypothetical protein [Phycisphaerae bacterium]